MEEAVSGDGLVDFEHVHVDIGRSRQREVTDVVCRRPVGVGHVGADLDTEEMQHVTARAARKLLAILDAAQRNHPRVTMRM